MKQILVAGFGCAGYHAVKAMREAGCADPIHVFTDCDEAPSSPMLTTYYVAGHIPFNALTPFGSLSDISAEFQLTVHSGRSISFIDYDGRAAICSDGTAYPYDKLLLATGASALIPGFPGSTLKEVYAMRTVKDALRLRERLDSGKVRGAVVAGASMVGIKLAELLAAKGVHTVLADTAGHIFPLSALPDTARRIEKRLEEEGVELMFGKGITSITEDPGGLAAHFGSDEKRFCDIIVICTGARANTDLAGNRLEVRRGIVTDRSMCAGVPGVYAAGDCCETRNLQSGKTQVIGLWVNAAEQGAVAGKNMAGCDAFFDGSITHNITHFFDMEFISIGDNRKTGSTVRFENQDGTVFVEAVFDDGKIACLNMLDCCEVSGIFKGYFVKRLLGRDVKLGYCEQIRLRRSGIPGWFISLLEPLQ